MTHNDNNSTADRAVTQYSVLRSVCYPENSPTSIDRTAETFSHQTRVHARTDGHKLTKINEEFFTTADVETQFIALLHEVTHTGDALTFGRGSSNHSPDFWREFQKNFSQIISDTQNRAIVESLFGGILNEFDWHRAKYRAIQNVSQVDKRSETIDQRKEKMANAIEYDTSFESSNWGLHMTGRTDTIHPDETAVHIKTGTKRYADDFTDTQLLDFINKHGGNAPAPLLILNTDDYNTDRPQSVTDDSVWKICPHRQQASKKALAVQERIGHGYTGLCAELIAMHEDKSAWAEAVPFDISEFPDPERIHHFIKFW